MERPILFSTPMIIALIDGRKSQTRRIVNTVNKIVIVLLRQEGCFIIFTAINNINYGKIDFKTDSDLAKQRLYGWERWTDLLQDEIQRLWSQGVRGLVSIKRLYQQQGIFDCILESREFESNKGSSQADLYGISWNASNYINASPAFGRKSKKQQAGKLEVGDTNRELAGSKDSRARDNGRESSDEQTNGHREISYSLGSRKGIGFTKAYCKDVGYVTIRYKQNLCWSKGMTLWVRETWMYAPNPELRDKFKYKASVSDQFMKEWKGNWKPSIFMPKEACRIKLLIKDIRVERLQDISEEDAKVEGCEKAIKWIHTGKIEVIDTSHVFYHHSTYKDGYKMLWEAINGKDSWEKNPWVWVIEFERITLQS